MKKKNEPKDKLKKNKNENVCKWVGKTLNSVGALQSTIKQLTWIPVLQLLQRLVKGGKDLSCLKNKTKIKGSLLRRRWQKLWRLINCFKRNSNICIQLFGTDSCVWKQWPMLLIYGNDVCVFLLHIEQQVILMWLKCSTIVCSDVRTVGNSLVCSVYSYIYLA